MKFLSRISVVMAVLALTAASATAQVTLLLEVDGIQGQSRNREYPDAIPISSAEWGVEAAIDVSSGARSNLPRASIVTIRKGLDAASPVLFQSATQGTLHNAILHVMIPDSRGNLVDAQTITFEDVAFVSIRQVLESEGVAEEIGLMYSAITVTSSEGTEYTWWIMAGGE